MGIKEEINLDAQLKGSKLQVLKLQRLLRKALKSKTVGEIAAIDKDLCTWWLSNKRMSG